MYFYSERFEHTPSIHFQFFFVHLFCFCYMEPPIIFRNWPILFLSGSEFSCHFNTALRALACCPTPHPLLYLPSYYSARSAIWSSQPVAYYPVDDSGLQSLFFSAILIHLPKKQKKKYALEFLYQNL